MKSGSYAALSLKFAAKHAISVAKSLRIAKAQIGWKQ